MQTIHLKQKITMQQNKVNQISLKFKEMKSLIIKYKSEKDSEIGQLNEELEKAGFRWGKDYAQVLHIHDEIQFEVHKDKLEDFKTITKSIFKKTQEHFNFRCPLDGEIKVGQNWSDTH